MILQSNLIAQAVECIRPKIKYFSYLTPEYFKYLKANLSNFITYQGITTSTIYTRGKEEKEIVQSTVKPIKMAFTSYEMTKGSGETDYPVIIMHGLLGSKSNWNSLSKAIHNKTKKKVVAVDARNHGESPHTTELTYNHLAADIKAFMEDLKIPKATLIGHSMGGRAVMLVALRNPELVKELIIVDISPLRTSPNLKHLLKCFEAMRLVKIEPKVPLSNARKIADGQLSKYITDPGLRQFLLTNLVEGEDGKYKWRVNLDSITSNFSTNISNFPSVKSVYNGPTLFIGGTSSDYLLKEDEVNISKLFPNATFAYIRDAGHWVHSEKPEEFLKIVTSFINNPECVSQNKKRLILKLRKTTDEDTPNLLIEHCAVDSKLKYQVSPKVGAISSRYGIRDDSLPDR